MPSKTDIGQSHDENQVSRTSSSWINSSSFNFNPFCFSICCGLFLVESKTINGFNVTFKNSSGTAVSKTFDLVWISL